MKHSKLYEGLERGDLNEWVSDTITIDRYRSKMGDDSEIVVLGFKVKDKYPATDLMEFIERGYKFILDSDMSAGEESDGTYHVFVEMPRTPDLGKQISELFEGIGQLCNCYDWKFHYQKSKKEYELTVENIEQQVPLTAKSYESKILEIKNTDVKRFFDQGSTEVSLDENNILTFKRPFSGELEAKFLAIGNFNSLKSKFPGALNLDESSQSQVLFLSKYLGNYDIDKIGDIFLIRNGNRGLAFKKERW